MSKIYQVYRLTLDENGQETCQDFSDMFDAESAFKKAVKRKSVFMARVDSYNAQTYKHIARIMFCDNESESEQS